jgi:hypothetical protein
MIRSAPHCADLRCATLRGSAPPCAAVPKRYNVLAGPATRRRSRSAGRTIQRSSLSPPSSTGSRGVDGSCGLAAKGQVRRANATERLTTKPPLCHECAKTGRHSPTIRGQSGHEPAAELGIPRRYDTASNALDNRARIYTPAVGGSIPSAPTSVVSVNRPSARRNRVHPVRTALMLRIR